MIKYITLFFILYVLASPVFADEKTVTTYKKSAIGKVVNGRYISPQIITVMDPKGNAITKGCRFVTVKSGSVGKVVDGKYISNTKRMKVCS